MIVPLGNKIKLDIKKVKIGAIESDSIEEHGTIIATPYGKDEEVFIVGKELYFKAWAVDVITQGEDIHYFISADSDAICGIEDGK